MVEFKFSDVSLGESPVKVGKNVYQRYHYKIKKLAFPRKDRNKRFNKIVVYPVQGWFPSYTENFVFKFDRKKWEPEYFIDMATEPEWNGAIWLHPKTGRYVLRVPKDRGRQVRERLYCRGLWYDTYSHLWCRRRKRYRKSCYPKFVRSLELQAENERKCHSKQAAQKRQSAKILQQKSMQESRKNKPLQLHTQSQESREEKNKSIHTTVGKGSLSWQR